MVWRFRTGSQWREMPELFGAWQTVYQRFVKWRDAGVFEALLEGAIAEAAKRGEADLSLVSVDSTSVRAHHDAAGMRLDNEVMAALEEAALEREEAARKKGERLRNRTDTGVRSAPEGQNADVSVVDAGPA